MSVRFREEYECPGYPYRQMAWFYAAVYAALSIAIEILLLVVGLRIPEDNGIIAPIILTALPLLAALLFRFRRAKEFLVLAILTAVLTFVLTVVLGRLTGINTGLALPIVVRSAAGFLAFVIARNLAARRR